MKGCGAIEADIMVPLTEAFLALAPSIRFIFGRGAASLGPMTAEQAAPAHAALFLTINQNFTSRAALVALAGDSFQPMGQGRGQETAPARASDEEEIGGIDPRGVEIGDL
ncbi:hypothetical protein BQ8794_90091 [Mesorhizobium prunaredense]|uniref:Uncharacterized protein n=1 Tax=Mesorhizobium prunaredense TaxID=1631249 RepID=A0A1R3VJ24_9HYPH|nr:hypothetical protein BQ8794_90091 [Mesorhizobium prunaredense]